MAANDLVTLADLKVFLGMSGTTYDTELPTWITTASDMIQNKIGPVAGSPSYDETYDGGGPTIALRHAPVLAVTSMTESWGSTIFKTLTLQVLDDGTAKDAYGYTIDSPVGGIISRRAVGCAVRFAPGRRNIHIVYTAGYASTPPELVTAAKLLVKHLWDSRRGGGKRPGSGGEDGPSRDDWSGWPSRVAEILKSFNNAGIA